jgi:hypothetical protein
MMNREAKINALRELLQFMREKSGMFFSTVSQADSHLRGFKIASKICLDLPDSTRFYATVITEHGWTWTSDGPWKEMREKGMDDTAIIDEMLSIEIEVWKRAYGNLD